MTATLYTERLVLRPVRFADFAAIQRHFPTWDIVRHLSKAVPWPYPEDGARVFLEQVLLPEIREGRTMAWALVLREGPDELIGLLEYRLYGADSRGFWLAVPYWGRGLMTEAVTAFQDHVFFDLGIKQLVVHNAVTNPASRRVKEKTGAEFVAAVEVPHHEGTATERWVVRSARWAEIRGRAL